jgi:uncharacterized membrane protein YozB (DUF420 family)
LLLVAGYWLIRHGRRQAHRRAMLAAVATSGLFLVSYLTYHFQVGSVRFTGQGFVRSVYFAVLISHTLLAVASVPLVLTTVRRGLAARFVAHRAIARWTLPLWLYVSVSGVVVYWMLYQL